MIGRTIVLAVICAVGSGACAAAPEGDSDPSLEGDPIAASDAGPRSPADSAMLAAAQAISARCASEQGCYLRADHSSVGLTLNETLILFRAAEIETGISARLLKAIAYGEGLGDGYRQHYPRHFYDLVDNPNFAGRATWAHTQLGLNVPLTLGVDTAYPTYGLGIFQLTADRGLIQSAVAAARAGRVPLPVQLYGGGRPYYGWPASDTVTIDVMRAIYDPYYNILQGARLIAFKMRIYTDPRSSVHWVSAHPRSDMDWALIGSTYQVYGGIGPGGGATLRIFNRMTNSTSAVYRDAFAFSNAEPTLD